MGTVSFALSTTVSRYQSLKPAPIRSSQKRRSSSRLHYACDSCRRTHWVGRSCGNRHCPNCQSDKTQFWLAKRTAQLLPVPYYLVTFTVPQALRKFVRANQRVCYQATGAEISRAVCLPSSPQQQPHRGGRPVERDVSLHTDEKS